MVVEENNSNNNNGGWAPIGSPMNVNVQSRDNSHLTNFESSVNAVSFGFVATAILISMFLLMAIFERFLRPNNSDEFSPSARRTSTDLEPQMAFPGKLGHPSPKMSVSANNSEVNINRATMVQCLVQGGEIKVHELIADGIQESAEKADSGARLWYPITILRLCNKAKVIFEDSSPDWVNPGRPVTLERMVYTTLAQ
nr:uncharacterized protein LOC114925353 [Arachis hypogaea]